MEIHSVNDCDFSDRLTVLRLRSRIKPTHSTTDESLMRRLSRTALEVLPLSINILGLAPTAVLVLPKLTHSIVLAVNRPQATKIRLEEVRRNPHSPRSVIESAEYKGRPIWLDWQVLNYLRCSKSNELLEPRVKNLSALFWTNDGDKDDIDTLTCAFRCLGYCKDEDSGQFSLVFQKPLQLGRFQTLAPLYGIINHRARDGNRMEASLAERTTLMYLIAETVERLHAAGWLLISL